MTTVLLVIHLLIAIAMVVLILLQRSEGGALGMGGGGGGGGGGGMSGFMTGRATANLLTRATAVLAAAFMATSLTLALMANNTGKPTSILDGGTKPGAESSAIPETETVVPAAPAEPEKPAAPAAPLAE
ncbi:preprotein translocase subunit SecG [Magnetospira sp. QH-2]|uniref:preprotein translocase subunit SecG n=1 Tax=Magnetospira sp. (strain QH-2) TaxID=1288970 RepID=UPI0003E80C7C|nr:preprotein translocase subunit SecG [Magnetospira sp. QH-2]CCQ73953.1 Putative Protein-export membrane protein [secG] [Magnetospira sp. QH-2]